MQYTTNYNYSLPESDDVLETASRVGYNNNFSDIDTQIKDANDDIDSIGEEVDTISTQIGAIDTQIGELDTRIDTIEARDYIVERGTTTTTFTQGGNQTWYYEKWNSGFCKAYTDFHYTGLNCSTQDSGASVYRTPSFQEKFPTMFTSVYATNITKSGGTAGWLQVGTGSSYANHILPQCYIIRGSSNSNISAYISTEVVGTWK